MRPALVLRFLAVVLFHMATAKCADKDAKVGGRTDM